MVQLLVHGHLAGPARWRGEGPGPAPAPAATGARAYVASMRSTTRATSWTSEPTTAIVSSPCRRKRSSRSASRRAAAARRWMLPLYSPTTPASGSNRSGVPSCCPSRSKTGRLQSGSGRPASRTQISRSRGSPGERLSSCARGRARRRRATPGARDRVPRNCATRRRDVILAANAMSSATTSSRSSVSPRTWSSSACSGDATRTPATSSVPVARTPSDDGAPRIGRAGAGPGVRSGTGRASPAATQPVEERRSAQAAAPPIRYGALRAESRRLVEDPLLDDGCGASAGPVVTAAHRHPARPLGLSTGRAGSAVRVDTAGQHQSGRDRARRGELAHVGPLPAPAARESTDLHAVDDASGRRTDECAWMQPMTILGPDATHTREAEPSGRRMTRASLARR